MKHSNNYLVSLYSLLTGFALTTISLILEYKMYRYQIFPLYGDWNWIHGYGYVIFYSVFMLGFSAALTYKFPDKIFLICLNLILSTLLAEIGMYFIYPQLLDLYGESLAWNQIGFIWTIPFSIGIPFVLSLIGTQIASKLQKR